MPRSFKISDICYCPFRKEVRLMAGIYVGVNLFVCLNSDHEDFEEGKVLPICQGRRNRMTEDFPSKCPGEKQQEKEE